MVDLKLVNAHLVFPEGIREGGVAVDEGKIVAVGRSDYLPPARREIDVDGKHILPGAIDPHVHLGYPDWGFAEDVAPSTKAAVAGGVTTLMHFLLEPQGLVEGFETKKKAFEGRGYTDIGFHAVLYSDQNIAEIPDMARLGVRSFKFLLPYRGSEHQVSGTLDIDDGVLYRGMREIAGLEPPGLAMVHCENIEIFFASKKSTCDRIGRTCIGTTFDPIFASRSPSGGSLSSPGRPVALFTSFT